MPLKSSERIQGSRKYYNSYSHAYFHVWLVSSHEGLILHRSSVASGDVRSFAEGACVAFVGKKFGRSGQRRIVTNGPHGQKYIICDFFEHVRQRDDIREACKRRVINTIVRNNHSSSPAV